jgi:hypothetical protein
MSCSPYRRTCLSLDVRRQVLHSDDETVGLSSPAAVGLPDDLVKLRNLRNSRPVRVPGGWEKTRQVFWKSAILLPGEAAADDWGEEWDRSFGPCFVGYEAFARLYCGIASKPSCRSGFAQSVVTIVPSE